MKLNTLFIITAISCLFFGLMCLFIPVRFFSSYGVTVTAAHAFSAQLLGAANLAIAVLVWLGRKSKDTKPIVISMFVFHVIGFVVSLLTMLNKVMGSSGWSAVVIFLVLTLGYAYFLFKK
jgi:hypothetical protein